MTPSSSGSARRLLSVLLACAGALLAAGATAPAAHADPPSLSFTLTDLTVSGNGPDDLVTLSGEVTNTGKAPVYGVQVILWRSPDPIQDVPTLRLAQDNSSGWGSRMPINADHYVAVTTSTEGFPAGTSRPVTLRATLRDLGFSTRPAAYAFGADVIGAEAVDHGYDTLARIRTFVPLPGKRPVPVTRLVLLTAPPSKLLTNLFESEALAGQLGGRLDDLLTAAARPGMSWLVDPALLDEVRDLADGYQVLTPAGPVSGGGQELAAAWLARFARLEPAAGARTLFASPDVSGGQLTGQAELLPRASRATEQVAGVAALPLVILPAAATLTTATYDYLAPAGAAAVVAGNANQAAALLAGTGTAAVLSVAPAPPAELGDVERRQLSLAHAALAGGAGQARLLAGPADLAADAAADASWLKPRSLAELLNAGPKARGTLNPETPPHLDQAQFRRIDRLERDFAVYGELVASEEIPGQAAATLSRAASAAWVGNDAGFSGYLAAVEDVVGTDAVQEAVALDASPRFLMSSRNNQFPVTVTNGLSQPIRVRVEFATDNPQRLTIPPSEVITVAAGRSETVNVRPEASANGLVVARAHVTTESGYRVTPDIRITVEVTDLGLVAWLIVGASGAVLVGATAWRIRQVRRRDQQRDAAAPA